MAHSYDVERLGRLVGEARVSDSESSPPSPSMRRPHERQHRHPPEGGWLMAVRLAHADVAEHIVPERIRRSGRSSPELDKEAEGHGIERESKSAQICLEQRQR
jgi:hypothetical protein